MRSEELGMGSEELGVRSEVLMWETRPVRAGCRERYRERCRGMYRGRRYKTLLFSDKGENIQAKVKTFRQE